MPAEINSTSAAKLVASLIALNLPTTKFNSRSHDVVIHVYDEARNVIETHEHAGDFREF